MTGRLCDACGRQPAMHEFIRAGAGREARAELLCTYCLIDRIASGNWAMVTAVAREGAKA